MMSSTFSDDRRVWCGMTFTSGLRPAIALRADSTLGSPTRSVACRIWRCRFDASNLQRQILHATDRVGLPKVESARKAIAGLNPDVKVIPHQTRLSSENVLDIIKDY